MTGESFIDIKADYTLGYVLFQQTIYQAVCSAFGMWFVFVVFYLLRMTDEHYQEVSLHPMISSWFGVWFPILPWNFGLFLAANTYSDPGI